MILVTHAVGGAAASLLFKTHPVLAFAAGFVSHFVLDAVPHWAYPLRSLVKDDRDAITHDHMELHDRRFLIDLVKTGADAGAGILIVILATWHGHPGLAYSALLGAIGGLAPDFLHLVYYLFPQSPLRHLEKFHIWIHGKGHLGRTSTIGIASQLALLIVFTLIVAR